MAKYKVFITYPIPEIGIKLLKKKLEVAVSHKKLPYKELLAVAGGYNGIMCLLTDKIDAKFLNANKDHLKIVANYAVGFDNIDIATAQKLGIYVSNTPGVLTEAVGEHAMALALAIIRRIVEADKFTKAGKYKGWEPGLFLGFGLKNRTLGIVGLGRIGSYLAQIAHRGFDMSILYNDVKPNAEFEKEYSAKYLKLNELLKKSDIVSLHVPLIEATRHLISTKQLSMMKKTAILINTSRGPVVDEKALVQALSQGIIAGAGLDVFENEPFLAPGLSKLSNVALTPHIASATQEAREAMAVIAAENILDVLTRNAKPRNLVETKR